MVAIYIEHKLDAGILTIARVRIEGSSDGTDDPQPAEVIQFRFECGATGAWFDADKTRDEISKMCSILGEDDELAEMLNIPPDVPASASGQNEITATFAAAGRKKSYPVPVVMTRRTYAADKQDIMELRAENAVLRRKVASLEDRIEILEEESNEHRDNTSRFAAHLLMAYGDSREFSRYTSRYPRLIYDDDKPILIYGGNVFNIMEWDNDELFISLFVNNITSPLIESILSIGAQRSPSVYLHTREKLVKNMSQMFEWYANDQTRFNNGTKLIDYITDQISISSQPNHQSHSDHDVWMRFKKCIETNSQHRMQQISK